MKKNHEDFEHSFDVKNSHHQFEIKEFDNFMV